MSTNKSPGPIHVILAANLEAAYAYKHRLGLSQCRTITCSIEADYDRLRGMNNVVIHRTQSWYRSKAYPIERLRTQAMLAHMYAKGRIRAVVNEVGVTNTTFLS